METNFREQIENTLKRAGMLMVCCPPVSVSGKVVGFDFLRKAIRKCLRPLVKNRFSMDVTVKATGARLFRLRLRLGTWLMKLAGFIMQMPTHVNVKEADNG
jgi:hypothetical protein